MVTIYGLYLGNELLELFSYEKTAKNRVKAINDGTGRELNLLVKPLEVDTTNVDSLIDISNIFSGDTIRYIYRGNTKEGKITSIVGSRLYMENDDVIYADVILEKV